MPLVLSSKWGRFQVRVVGEWMGPGGLHGLQIRWRAPYRRPRRVRLPRTPANPICVVGDMDRYGRTSSQWLRSTSLADHLRLIG